MCELAQSMHWHEMPLCVHLCAIAPLFERSCMPDACCSCMHTFVIEIRPVALTGDDMSM